jgi:hypothetical protein
MKHALMTRHPGFSVPYRKGDKVPEGWVRFLINGLSLMPIADLWLKRYENMIDLLYFY